MRVGVSLILMLFATLIAVAETAGSSGQCQVTGSPGAFVLGRENSPGSLLEFLGWNRPSASCMGTLVDQTPLSGGGCRISFITAGHCMVDYRKAAQSTSSKDWLRFPPGTRVATSLGSPLQVETVYVDPGYLKAVGRLQGKRGPALPREDVAFVTARLARCASVSPLPILEAEACENYGARNEGEAAFLLACPRRTAAGGNAFAVELNPVLPLDSREQEILERLGLVMGRTTAWKGYAPSRKGCSGGPWLKYERKISGGGRCEVTPVGICGVHVGHFRNKSTARTGTSMLECRATDLLSGRGFARLEAWCEGLYESGGNYIPRLCR